MVAQEIPRPPHVIVDRPSADVDRDAALVVRERELPMSEDEHLHGGVGGARCGGLAMTHDGVHDCVAERAHLSVAEGAGALGVAALTAARLGRHLLYETDTGETMAHRTSGLLRDLYQCVVIRGGCAVVGGGRRGVARGHSSAFRLVDPSDWINMLCII